VHIGSMGGDVRPAPGSGAPDGERKIAEIMNKVLAQVRRHVRERARAVTGDIDHDGDGFYHLAGAGLTAAHCQGTACFAARHLDPDRWERAQQEPRVYCLGKEVPPSQGRKSRSGGSLRLCPHVVDRAHVVVRPSGTSESEFFGMPAELWVPDDITGLARALRLLYAERGGRVSVRPSGTEATPGASGDRQVLRSCGQTPFETPRPQCLGA